MMDAVSTAQPSETRMAHAQPTVSVIIPTYNRFVQHGTAINRSLKAEFEVSIAAAMKASL